MNYQKLLIILTLSFISSCASVDPQKETVYVKQLAWENYKGCKNKFNRYYQREDAKEVLVCSVKYMRGMPKHHAQWEEGKEYMAFATKDREFQLEPIYDQIYAPEPTYRSDPPLKVFLYRKKKGDFFIRYDLRTNTEKVTPIDHLELGKTFYRATSFDKVRKDKRLYSGAFSDNMQAYYFLDNEFNIIKKIENVDNDIKRKLLFPPVHSLRLTFHVSAKNETRMIRHNLKGRVFYQVYDPQGNKLGDEIDFKKVVYFYQKTSRNVKDATYDVRPWVAKGGGVYMPIIHHGSNIFFDGTKDYGDFLGQYILPVKEDHRNKVFVGYQEAKGEKIQKSTAGPIVFKDDKGIYFTKLNYDFHGAAKAPMGTVNYLKKKPESFYREVLELPFYPGTLTSTGDLVIDEIEVYRELDDSYSIEKNAFIKRKMSSIHPVNQFKSIEEVERTLIKVQEDLIAKAKIRAEKDREKREYQESLAAARARTDDIMANSRSARDERQKNHSAKMAIKDHNKKYEKPNPLFNLDLHKIMDSAGAKRKAACYKKMSDSKKKYLSGSQGWYLQGKCK